MTAVMHNSRILVTGASGFIGKALTSRLLTFVDPSNIVVTTHQNFMHDLPCRHFNLALASTTQWDAALDDVKVIIHCAARVHVMNETSADSLGMFRAINVEGTLNLARQAAAKGVRRFIYLSSVKVNGELTTANHFFSPDDTPDPKDAYGISKMEAEYGLQVIANETGMELVIIRPPLVYGPGVKANFLSLIRLISKGIPLPLGAVLHNRRSFVSLDNLVDLLICCVDHPAAANEIFMVSDGEDISTTTLLIALSNAMGKRPRLLPIPPILLRFFARLLGKKSLTDRLLGNLQVDISKTTQRLDWRPCMNTREGLELLFMKAS